MIITQPFSSNVTVLESKGGVFRGKDKIVNDDEYFFRKAYQANVAAEYPHIQVWNPSGSGKTVIVDNIMGSLNSSTDLTLCTYNTQLSTLDGTVTSFGHGSVSGSTQIRTESSSSTLGTEIYHMRTISAFREIEFPIGWGFQLAEDEGLLIRAEGAERQLTAEFWVREI